MKKADALFDIGDVVYIPAHIAGIRKAGDIFVYYISESEFPVKESDCRTVDETISHQRAAVALHVDASELNEVKEQVDHFREQIDKANSILNELASKEIEIKVKCRYSEN